LPYILTPMVDKILSDEQAIALLSEANQRLRAGKIGVVLEMRGKKRNLSVRGMFPPKPGSNRTGVVQTRHSLERSLLTRQDLKDAEQIAKAIGVDLNAGTFDWRKWTDWEDEPTDKTAGDWMEELKRNYFNSRGDGARSLNTWRTNYQSPLATLPKDQPLTAQLIYDWVLANTQPGTSNRRNHCVAAKALAETAGIEISLKEIGRMTVKPLNPRSLPSDGELLEIRESISNPGWKYIFSLQLVYGLRSHEVWLTDLKQFPRLKVTNGKTGPRTVIPLLPEWAEEWNLQDRVLPVRIKLNENDPFPVLGKKTTKGYKTLGLPTPYTLRHAYARRALELGIEPSLGAKLMGHSLQVHTQTYRAWIEDSVYLNAIDDILRNRHPRN